MVHDALDLGAGQSRVHGDGLEPALVRREPPVQHVDAVGQGIRDDVACGETAGPQ